MSPLRFHKKWVSDVQKRVECLHQVDAHNIVPLWVTSQKKEFAARTIRPKVRSSYINQCAQTTTNDETVK